MRPTRWLASSLTVFLAFSARAHAAPGSSVPDPPKLRLPAVAAPTGYSAELSIDPGKDTFTGSIDIDIRILEKTSLLWLHSSDQAIREASANAGGRAVGVRILHGGENFVGFAFDRPLAPGGMRLHVEYTGRLDETSTQGLFRQRDGSDWYVFSQLETTDARRAFPCFDEPSFKVPWQLTLRIPAGTTAVSNTPIDLESAGPDGARVVRFKKTEPLPSYLVALAVGPFECLDAGRAGAKKTPIRIVTPRGKASQGRYAAQTTGPLLERLEAYFGIPYPYEKLDQLAIPQTVTFSAMENAGLITWSERTLLAPPEEETIRFQRSQASINAHELAHQWFGDLVTLAWWDDVWLNESFATWMADRTIIEWKPEWAEDVARVVASSNVMVEDTLVSARKIRQEIRSNDDIVNAFDGISYQKGAAVLTMFEAWTGPETFRTGVHDYLEAHRFGSATVKDFLRSIEAATRPGVAAAFSTFLEQPGVPVVAVAFDCAGGAARLSLSQKRLLPIGSTGGAAETWRVPVCVRAGAGGKDARGCSLLTEPKGAMPAPGGACPTWALGNDGGLGYYRTLYEGDLLRRLVAAADTQLTVAERVGVIRDVGALAQAGELPIFDALALVPRFSGDPSRQVVEATRRIAADVEDHLVAPDRRGNYARFVSKVYGQRARALGFIPRAGEDDDTRLLRKDLVGFVALEGAEPGLQAEAKRLALRWLDDRAAVNAEMTGDVLQVAARYGDRALFDRFRAAAKAAPERRDRGRLYYALGSFIEPPLLQEAFALTLDPSLDFRETFASLYAALGTDAGRSAVWDFTRANFDAIVARMPRETTGEIAFAASGFCDAAGSKEAKAFLGGRVEKLPGGPRNLAQTLEVIQLCIATRAAQEPGVGEFLSKY